MSDETTLEQAKDDLTTMLAKLKTANKNALKNVIDSELPETTPEVKESETKSYWLLLLVLIAIIFAIGLVVSNFIVIDDSNPLERKHFYSFLAFSVALASYLAATIREIVKALANSHKKRALKWNIFRITVAEASLLIFGLLIIYRIFSGIFTFWVLGTSSDAFILSYLSVILIYLMILHVWAWFTFTSPPWKIPK